MAVTVLGTGNTTVNQTNQDKPEAVEERKGKSGPFLGELTLHQLRGVKQLLYESWICTITKVCSKCLGGDLGEESCARLHGGGGIAAGQRYFTKYTGDRKHAQQKEQAMQRHRGAEAHGWQNC